MVRTGLWASIPEPEREAFDTAVGQALLSSRVRESQEIAQTHLYLMQDACITGAVIPLNGGARLI
jgi:hypothetical protein